MRHLENLESLSIWNCKELDLSKDEQGNVMMELQGLKNLKFLTIHNASKLEFLPEWMSRAYTLRYLCIRSCPNLAALPRWLEDRRSLKLLELVHCPQLRSLADGMYGFSDKYPRKLNIVGCPLLKCEGIEYSRRLLIEYLCKNDLKTSQVQFCSLLDSLLKPNNLLILHCDRLLMSNHCSIEVGFSDTPLNSFFVNLPPIQSLLHGQTFSAG